MSCFSLQGRPAVLLAAALLLAGSGRAPAAELAWDRALQLALQHNATLAQARLEAREAEGVILAARSVFLPSVRATAVSLPPLAVLDVRQDLFNPRAWADWETARAGLPAAVLNEQAALWRLTDQLRAAYLQAAYRQRLLELRVTYAAEVGRSRDAAARLFEAGRLRSDAVRRYEVNLASARADVEQARNLHEQAWLRLVDLIGIPDAATRLPGRVSGAMDAAPPRETDPAVWIPQALASRPDLRALEAAQEVRSLRIEALKKAGLPVLAAIGRGEIQSEADFLGEAGIRTNEDDEEVGSQFFFGATFNWLVWDGGARTGRTRAAGAEWKKADVFLAELRQVTIPNQVRAALAAVETAARLRAIAPTAESGAAFDKMARDLGESGTITQLEVLDTAQQRLRSAETALQAQFRMELALLSLQTASGQLVVYRFSGR